MLIDVTNWKKEIVDAPGNREKVWVISPEDKKYLLKRPHEKTMEAHSEVMAYYIGTKLFNLQIPKTYLALYENKEVTISRDFRSPDDYEFHESVDYFQEYLPNFDEYSLVDYTIENALGIVEEFGLLKSFYEMCIFDTLIANQDRHVQNWGIFEFSDTNRIFAPLYDNGSSLGALESEERVSKMLKDQNMFLSYNRRGRTIFTIDQKNKPSYQLLIRHLLLHNQSVFLQVIKKFDYSLEELKVILTDEVFSEISDERKLFIIKLIEFRKNEIFKFV
ncbi:MAG: HipA domain-containing protein [Streptococcaceae bacterium]|jgi:hypothetical protein|nr:HipA domain-containing protein [Streptococcaceae bacterium]